MTDCTAIVFDETQQCWMRYDDPGDLLCATHIDEVVPVLQQVEEATARGLTAIGYVAYEAATAFDASLKVHKSQQPLAQFAVFESGRPIEMDAEDEPLSLGLSLQINQSEYETQLGRIKQHLEAGDVYQVNFTHQLRTALTPQSNDSLQIFQQLLKHQASTRSVFFRTETTSICSVSPELFFALDGQSIRMEPMKGTRPRGTTQIQDEGLRQQLVNSEKERAENLMIVDMVRNDLGKIAVPGSVKVDQLFKLIPLPSLWQQVSQVSARTDASLTQLFAALFPCASITGAPKAKSMELIHDLEGQPRGVYTGAIGYVKPGRDSRFSVAIRSLLISQADRSMSYGVGSGVVWDSVPASEWQETLDKAKVLTRASPTDFELLETLAYIPNEGILLKEFHLQRLQTSAEYFKFALDSAAIEKLLSDYTAESRKRVRLLVDQFGNTRMEAFDLIDSSEAVTLKLAVNPIDSSSEFLRHKTTRREVYDTAKAACEDCDDVILWNEKGELTETSIYNLYLQFGDRLLTPAAESGLLPGTYRRQMLESGEAEEAVLTVDDLQRADALLVSNSVRGLRPALLLTPALHSKAG
ncbi:MAG: chorismate-binding protein [Pseudomonadales bacterium]|nr:chorismate-binding protein [Pseudomonadales bacterium]